MRDGRGTNAGWRGVLAARHQRLVITAFLGALALPVAACSGSTGTAAVHVSAARLTITPANGSTNAEPNQGVTVAVSRGKVKNVTVTLGSDPVSGYFNATDTIWHSTWALQPSRNYTVTATAVDSSGRTVTETSSSAPSPRP